MKPLTRDVLHEVVNRREILLCNQTHLTTDYVESIVVRSTRAFKTRSPKGLSLPMELWIDILEFARLDPVYRPVQPQFFRKSGSELVCLEVVRREKCGEIKSGLDLQYYESYLKWPNGRLYTWPEGPPWLGAPRPFETPNVLNDFLLELIPVSLLGSQNPQWEALYYDVKVRDIVARVEQGVCRICNGDRWLPVPDDRTRRHLMVFRGIHDLAPGSVLCPLCVGPRECSRSIRRLEAVASGLPVVETEEEYKAWARRHLEELGYR